LLLNFMHTAIRNNILPLEQFGFRRQSSCEMALFAATDSWMKSVDRGSFAGALLVDLSKAFDTVSHQLLLTELRDIGCSILKSSSGSLTTLLTDSRELLHMKKSLIG